MQANLAHSISCQLLPHLHGTISRKLASPASQLPQTLKTCKRSPRRTKAQEVKKDPLDADVWDSWQNQEDDWETENFTENELIDILFDVRAHFHYSTNRLQKLKGRDLQVLRPLMSRSCMIIALSEGF